VAFDVEGYLKTALGDASGAAVGVGRQFLDSTTGTPINLGVNFQGLGSQLGGLKDFLNPASGATDILDVLIKALEEFFESSTFSDVLDKPLKEFMRNVLVTFNDGDVKVGGVDSFFGSFLQAVVKLLVEILDQIVVTIQQPMADVSQKLFLAIGGLIQQVFKTLLDALAKDLNQFPAALLHGPFEALSAVNGLKTLLNDLQDSSGVTYLQGVLDRTTAVGNSLKSLIGLLTSQLDTTAPGKDNAGLVLIEDLIDQSTQLINGLLSASTPTVALESLLEDLFIKFPIDTLVSLFQSAFQQKLFAWTQLPSMLPVGMLNGWLNDPNNYSSAATKVVERQFRVRMVAVADAYIRQELDVPGQPFAQKMPLNQADQRDSGQALCDAICLLFDTIIHFVLEPECFPLIDLDLHGIEDLGIRFAMLLAREIRISIRALIGLVLRGFWWFSFMNTVLIEFIAVLIGVFFSALIEAAIRNLTWSLQVVSCYGSALFDDPSQDVPTLKATPLLGGAQLVYYWPSAETAANTGQPVDRLWYIATVRNPDVTLPSGYPQPYHSDPKDDPLEWKYVLGLLRDFGAYIDVCYQRFRIDSRFPVTEANDEVTITRAEISGKTLTVWATTTATFEQPQPILRAYFCCQVVPLRSGSFPGDPYTVEVEIEAAPRCVDVVVLSNRGGVGRRRAIRG